ncbi:MAG: single-stranded DNA-binding protein, partial [Rhodospirillaceae bacterium]|nr:single-stranded DNA-binding protein [Rhodospirillaceae bacterium]
KTEWHRVVTFQPGLVDMLVRHARKGRLVYVAGKLQTRRWKRDCANPCGVLHCVTARFAGGCAARARPNATYPEASTATGTTAHQSSRGVHHA